MISKFSKEILASEFSSRKITVRMRHFDNGQDVSYSEYVKQRPNQHQDGSYQNISVKKNEKNED